jgi:hypothetical protein
MKTHCLRAGGGLNYTLEIGQPSTLTASGSLIGWSGGDNAHDVYFDLLYASFAIQGTSYSYTTNAGYGPYAGGGTYYIYPQTAAFSVSADVAPGAYSISASSSFHLYQIYYGEAFDPTAFDGSCQFSVTVVPK